MQTLSIIISQPKGKSHETATHSYQRAHDFLRSIESGEILLTTSRSPREVHSGNMTYKASNGWEILIFKDSGERDHVDSISTEDARLYRFVDTD